MTARMDTLIQDNYSVLQFKDLPAPHQLAIVWHMAIDGDAWRSVRLPSCEESELGSVLIQMLPKYVEIYGETLFGSACLSAAAIKDAVMRDADISEGFSCWGEYHSWYLSGGDVPEHPKNARWPVILSNHDSETLRDGWHRFHSYIRDGAADIQAVFHPEVRHLAASVKATQRMLTADETGPEPR